MLYYELFKPGEIAKFFSRTQKIGKLLSMKKCNHYVKIIYIF